MTKYHFWMVILCSYYAWRRHIIFRFVNITEPLPLKARQIRRPAFEIYFGARQSSLIWHSLQSILITFKATLKPAMPLTSVSKLLMATSVLTLAIPSPSMSAPLLNLKASSLAPDHDYKTKKRRKDKKISDLHSYWRPHYQNSCLHLKSFHLYWGIS